MSYSFNITAESKADATAQVTTELAKVVASQPVHAKDCAQAQAAADSYIALLPEPNDTQSIFMWVSGALGWTGDGDDKVFNSASVNVAVSVGAKQA